MTSNECTIPHRKVKRKKRERRLPLDIRPTRWQRQALARAISEARAAQNPVKAIDVFANPEWWKKEGKA